jgi:hypothetical protein
MRSRLAILTTVCTATAFIVAGCATPVASNRPGSDPSTPAVSASAGQSPTPGPGDGAAPTTAPVEEGISGLTAVQTCPVVRADPPCPDTPVAARLSIERPDGTVLTTLETDATGQFVIQLSPGHYLVQPLDVIGGTSRPSAPLDVDVQVGRYTPVTVRFDTGIR